MNTNLQYCFISVFNLFISCKAGDVKFLHILPSTVHVPNCDMLSRIEPPYFSQNLETSSKVLIPLLTKTLEKRLYIAKFCMESSLKTELKDLSMQLANKLIFSSKLSRELESSLYSLTPFQWRNGLSSSMLSWWIYSCCHHSLFLVPVNYLLFWLLKLLNINITSHHAF